MAISQEQGRSIIVQHGANQLHIWAQNADTLYVRAGVDSHGQPLELRRGAVVSFRGHYTLTGEGWTCPQPFVHRVDQGRGKDATAAQVKAAVMVGRDAILSIDPARLTDLLEGAGRDAAASEALERLTHAKNLRQLADHLELEAQHLASGGRVAHFDARHPGGYSERITCVITANGDRLEPPRELSPIYGASKYPTTGATLTERA